MDATEFEELQQKFDDSEKRSHQVLIDLRSNTMDDLIAERRSRRVLVKQIEDLQADHVPRKRRFEKGQKVKWKG